MDAIELPLKLKTLGERLGLPVVDLTQVHIEDQALRDVPPDAVRRYGVLPLRKEAETLFLAVHDPYDIPAIDQIRVLTGLEVAIMLAEESQLKAAIRRFFGE